MSQPILKVEKLNRYFGALHATRDVSFEVPQGKTVGIVGESGCGKSVTSLSLMQLVQRPAGQTRGRCARG